ncbi:MAG: hypothetical protein L0H84_23325 [Pseudonocardia sp.]|nr:hypothetical protein [Pseudonocardia sp.]
MSVDASDVLAVLPPDHRVGEIEVLDVRTDTDIDDEGRDVVRVFLTLSSPRGETWRPADLIGLQVHIQRGLVARGEEDMIVFRIRPESEDGAPDDGPLPPYGE